MAVTGVSRRGTALIEAFEGFRDRAYRDSVGVLTIGFGHTEGVRPGQRIGRAEATALLAHDLDHIYLPAVKRLRTYGSLDQNQVDALVSFVYNVGLGGITRPPVGPALRARRWRDAANGLLQWDHAGGARLAGLTRRRQAERKLFLTPAPPAHTSLLDPRHATTRVVTFDGTPTFLGIARVLHDVRIYGAPFTLTSADRRRGIPERYGRLSQAALYAGWLAHKAGFLPANPPGRSTHELRSDSVAYRGPVGRPLAWWQEGLDFGPDRFGRGGASDVLAALLRLGYRAHRPYPTGSEAHHINFRSNPRRHWFGRYRHGWAT